MFLGSGKYVQLEHDVHSIYTSLIPPTSHQHSQSITGTIPDCLFTSNGFGVSELALHPSEDRPSNYGYIQQAHSYLEAVTQSALAVSQEEPVEGTV